MFFRKGPTLDKFCFILEYFVSDGERFRKKHQAE